MQQTMSSPKQAAVGSKRPEVAVWLMQELAQGPRQARDLLLAAERRGYSVRTLKRAKATLSIISRRRGFGPGSCLEWSLSKRTKQAVSMSGHPTPSQEAGGKTVTAQGGASGAGSRPSLPRKAGIP